MPIRRTDRLREPLPWSEQEARPPRRARAQFRRLSAGPQPARVAAELALRRSYLQRVGSGGEVPQTVPRCGHRRALCGFARVARQVPQCGGGRPRLEGNPAISLVLVRAAALAGEFLRASLWLFSSIQNWQKKQQPVLTGQ